MTKREGRDKMEELKKEHYDASSKDPGCCLDGGPDQKYHPQYAGSPQQAA